MAMVQFGGGVTDMVGSIGGTTFSRAQGMSIAKRRATPRNRINFDRSQNQSYLSAAVWRWKTILTSGNITDWNDAAANFAQTRHGVAYEISGLNLYTAVYSLCQIASETCPNAPTIFTGRPLGPSYTPSWNAVTHKVKITMATAMSANQFLLFWNTNADRPNSTNRKIPYRNYQDIEAGDGAAFDLEGQYRSANGTIFWHYIVLDIRGAMSSYSRSYYSYTYS